MRPAVLAALAAAVAITACSDTSIAPLSPEISRTDLETQLATGEGDFQRYVAIGTSVSMGVQSDGVNSATQINSWPAQLGRLAKRDITLPLIAFPGCASPLAAPLASGLRLSGEGAGLPFADRQCAPNEPGVILPTANVAIDGARTSAALTATPENPDPGHAMQYPRVLPPGKSQVTAMEMQSPKIVSVELGANEVLGARYGIYAAPYVVPVAEWKPQYRQVLEHVGRATKKAVLVGLLNDVRSFPSFRTGDELWNARATFAPFNVAVSTDCQASDNLLFVAVRVPVAVATGAFYAGHGLGAYTLSCANAPSASGVEDYVLAPSDVSALNAQLVEMSNYIREQARLHGYAYFPLGALYEDVVTKAPFNAVTLMTSGTPYGPYVSLDGLHPSAAGQTVIADAAARALNATYHMQIQTSSGVSFFASR